MRVLGLIRNSFHYLAQVRKLGEAPHTAEASEFRSTDGLSEDKQRVVLEFSIFNILKLGAILLGIYGLYYVSNIVLSLFVALILSSAIQPVVKSLHQRLHIPPAFSALLLLLLIFGLLIWAFSLLVPSLTAQLIQIYTSLPDYFKTLNDRFPIVQQLSNSAEVVTYVRSAVFRLSANLNTLPQEALSTTLSFVGGIFAVFINIVFTFYLITEKELINRFLCSVLPADQQDRALLTAERVQKKLGAWVRGQLILALFIGVISYVVLTVLDVEFALTLALLAGIFELLPVYGAFLAAIPAILFALPDGLDKVIYVAIAYLVIQQIENNILVPKVMQRAVGLNPLVILLVILLGGRFFGLLGVIIAVPLTTTLLIIWKEYLQPDRGHRKPQVHEAN